MRSFREEHLNAILKKHTDFKPVIFVETGTYKGLTIFPMSKLFKFLYTIEINKNSYDYCVNEAKKNKITNIKFINGDSSDEILTIIKELNKNVDYSCLFFLDAHWTDNKTIYTSRGPVDVPVLSELSKIGDLYKGSGVVVIDDTRLLGCNDMKLTAGADWSNITFNNIKNSFNLKRIEEIYFTDGDKNEKNDRIIIKFKKL
jgi:hypothetical protein